MAADKLGLDARVYYGTAGSAAATELTIVQDLKQDDGKANPVDVTRRHDTQKRYQPGLKEFSFTLTIFADTTNAGYTALLTAFSNKTAIALYVKNAASGTGLDADFYVVDFKRTESADNAQLIECKLVRCGETRDASWH